MSHYDAKYQSQPLTVAKLIQAVWWWTMFAACGLTWLYIVMD